MDKYADKGRKEMGVMKKFWAWLTKLGRRVGRMTGRTKNRVARAAGRDGKAPK